jgi:hypothetical protein
MAYWTLYKWGRKPAGQLVVLHIDSIVEPYCLASMSFKTLVCFRCLLRSPRSAYDTSRAWTKNSEQ